VLIVGLWWLTPVILASQEAEIRRIWVQSQPWANNPRDPISKIPDTKEGWWSDQAVECLLSKNEALNSNPSIGENKKNTQILLIHDHGKSYTIFLVICSFHYRSL
jgi:hypothetical protein